MKKYYKRIKTERGYITFKYPSLKDINNFTEFSNSLIKNGDLNQTNLSSQEYIEKSIENLKSNNGVTILAKHNGKIIGNADLINKKDRERHVAELGIMILDEYRNMKIGTRMIKELLRLSKETGTEIVTLTVDSENKRAIHVYESIGFKKCGRIPRAIKKEDRYKDKLIFYKDI